MAELTTNGMVRAFTGRTIRRVEIPLNDPTGLTLVLDDGAHIRFRAVGDDMTYLSVGVERG